MNKRRILACASIIMMLTLSVLVVSNQPPKSIVKEPEQPAKFVLSSWDYPDEYGQGIYGFRFYENSTGAWDFAPWYYVGGALDGLPYYFLHPYDPYALNWSEGVAMKIRVFTTFNNTIVGAIDEADGQNYQRHNVTVTSAGVPVFSQSNFTYYDVTPDGDYWAYEYEVILDFLPVAGEIYTVVVDYDIWHPPPGSTNQTMHFETGDPYDGYDKWTYEYLGGEQTPATNQYLITTNTDGYTQYFGYDAFATQNDIMSEVVFNPMVLAGAYRFEPLAYFYQKTELNLGTNLAVAIFWYESNLYLYHNTAHGESVSSELLASVSPVVDHVYSCLLANSGNDTWVRIYDYNTSSVVYNGTTTTFNYDATTLYAGFGQYSMGDGGVAGRWDNFTVVGFALPASWNTVSTAILLFSVPFDMWGMDTALIILGLVMIPVSTIYLAYGIKHDRSSDRLFYGLIIFMVGCGLLIGGILP